MSQPLTFYDIPSPTVGAWSPNTWKGRYILNMKGIPYKTVWVEFPDIEPLLKKIGVKPTRIGPDGKPVYTLPTIYDPNTKTAVTNAIDIARYLERTYPEKGPTLIPPEMDALHNAFDFAFYNTTVIGSKHLMAIVLLPIYSALSPRDQEWYRPKREAVVGPLEALAPVGSDKCAEHWKGLEKDLGTLASWIGTAADGTERRFVGGDRIFFADIVLAALLRSLEKVLAADDWQDILSWQDRRWSRFMQAFRSYESEDVGSAAEL